LFDHELAWKDEDVYKRVYAESVSSSDSFWLHQSRLLSWCKKPSRAIGIGERGLLEWFPDGKASVVFNCIGRHALSSPDKKAIIWHGDEYEEKRELTFLELHDLVLKVGRLLKSMRVSRGDVVAIYMPVIPEAIAFMLACSLVGAIHMVVFAGFSAEAFAYRLQTSCAKVVVSVPSFFRGGKKIDLKDNIDLAFAKMKTLPQLLMIDDAFLMNLKKTEPLSDCYESSAGDDLFILYTSGSSGQPKGIFHSVLGYLTYVASTSKYVFDMKCDDVHFCTSDIGWITGHSYSVYGPLLHGATIVLFGGNPTYPDASRLWHIVEQEKVSILYTAPTVVRSLMCFDDSFIAKHDLSSLRILGSVGEPINKDAWTWYFSAVGGKRCPIVDTWWQTETGGIVIAPLLNLHQKPSVAAKPFFGIKPAIIDANTQVIHTPKKRGSLVITNGWPGMCRCSSYECEINNSSSPSCCLKEFTDNYFREGFFISGDGAFFDEDNDIKITGRIDDVLNICGHRFGTAEFEEVVNNLDFIRESAVVSVNHNIKGQAAFVFAVLSETIESETAYKAIIANIRKKIGPIAKPDFILLVDALPKTRSGKIVRSLLKKIANNSQIDLEKDLLSAKSTQVVSRIMAEIGDVYRCPDSCFLRR
jgi:acetyl-CoA synthetase